MVCSWREVILGIIGKGQEGVFRWRQRTLSVNGTRITKADSLRPRHEASKMEPTVHGSWPRVFLFYQTARTKEDRSIFEKPRSCFEKSTDVQRTHSKPEAHRAMLGRAHTGEVKKAVSRMVVEKNMSAGRTNRQGRRAGSCLFKPPVPRPSSGLKIM